MYPGHDPLVVDVNVPSRIDFRRAAGVMIVSVSVLELFVVLLEVSVSVLVVSVLVSVSVSVVSPAVLVCMFLEECNSPLHMMDGLILLLGILLLLACGCNADK